MIKKIKEEPWSFSLYEDDGGLILSVLCGTGAMYETVIRLNEDESNQVESGKLNALVESIRNHPGKFKERRIQGLNL